MTWPFGELRMFGYDLAVVDPPWPWEAYGENGYAKSPEAQYRTMPLRDIAALPVGQLLGAGGAVFLWCTWPLVAQGVHAKIFDAWGVKGKTGGAWAKRTGGGKLRWGPGYIVRTVCEPWFIGTIGDTHRLRGRASPNLIETGEDALFDGLARQHSRKPDEAYAFLEALTPKARRADLFARQRRPGWDAWGDELDKFEGAAA